MSTNTFYESYFSCNVGTVSKIVRRSQATPDSLAYLRQRQQILRRSLVNQFVFPLSFCVYLFCVSCLYKLFMQFICRQISFKVFYPFLRLLFKGWISIFHDIQSVQSVRHADKFLAGLDHKPSSVRTRLIVFQKKVHPSAFRNN